MQGKSEAMQVEVSERQDPVPLREIKISPLNPRYESATNVDGLAADVDDRGLLQPIILRTAEDGGYEVIIGSRRFRAILAKRGPDGFLQPDEYTLEDWDDTFVIGAAVAENDCREPLSPVDEGRFLNRIASRDPTMTDTHLANLTGIGSRPRVNDLRHLATHFGQLPESWQMFLQVPHGDRPGDKPGISLTHYKAVRAYVGENGVEPWMLELMDKAAAGLWSVDQLKKAINDAKLGDPKAPKAPAKEAAKPTAPAYGRILKLLESATKACGTDTDLAGLVEKLADHVREKVAVKGAEANAAVSKAD